MGMTYTIDGVVHHGFQKLGSPDRVVPGTRVVIIWMEGEPDLWCVETKAGLDALRKTYFEEWPETSLPETHLVVVDGTPQKPLIDDEWTEGGNQGIGI